MNKLSDYDKDVITSAILFIPIIIIALYWAVTGLPS